MVAALAMSELFGSELKFALLVDGDNISGDDVKKIMDEATKLGTVTIRYVYGDWTNNCLEKWKRVVSEYSLTPRQQFANIKGKNATDSMLIIDCMDILYREPVDGFIIVSSDSDYTSLAKRLRQSGKPVIGMGNKNTHTSFRNSCTRFIVLDLDDYSDDVSPEIAPTSKEETGIKDDKVKVPEKAEIIGAIGRILEEYHDDGKVLLTTLNVKLVNRYPDFSSKNYEFKNLSKMLIAWGFSLTDSNKSIKCPVEPDSDYKPVSQHSIPSEEALKKEIKEMIKKSGESKMKITQIHEDLMKAHPTFKIKTYKCTRMKQLLVKLGFKLDSKKENVIRDW